MYVSLQLAKIQANYHRQSLKLLDDMLPSLSEEIGMCAVLIYYCFAKGNYKITLINDCYDCTGARIWCVSAAYKYNVNS